MQTPRIVTLTRVFRELIDLHHDQPQCPGAEHCPTARAIADLEILIGEMTLEAGNPNRDRQTIELLIAGEYLTRERFEYAQRIIDGAHAPEAEATYPPMKVEDIDPDTAHAILRAQGGIGQ